VVAPPACWIDRSCLLKASAGVFQPRVLRGRLLSALATAWISSLLQRARSVPLGKYWRTHSVLVRAALPRALGIGEEDRHSGLDLELDMSRQLLAAVPGQRTAQMLGQRGDRRSERVLHGDRPVASQRRPVLGARDEAVAGFAGQVDQHREPRAALDKGADRGALQADDQVAFRKTEPGSTALTPKGP